MKKYKNGTKLIVLFQRNYFPFNKGDTVTITESRNYPDSYAFQENYDTDDPGWNLDYIEDITLFTPMAWKERYS